MSANHMTVAELDAMMRRLGEIEDEIEKLEAQVTVFNKEYGQIQARCTAYLKELNRKDYVSPYGKLTRKQEWTVTLPKDKNKYLFFDYLKKKGIFEDLIGIHSKTLQAYYNAEWKVAEDEGGEAAAMTFSLPGIGAPKLFETVKYKPVKKKGGDGGGDT